MKNPSYNSTAGRMVAGLAAVLIAASAFAQDAGVVRIGDGTFEAAPSPADTGRNIARGQSPTRPRTTSPGLLQLLSGNYDTTPADGPSCAPADCDSCCPTNGDGCCDVCKACGGNGCHRCNYTGLAGGSGCSLLDRIRGGNGSGYGGYGPGACGNQSCVTSFLSRQCAIHNARRRANNARLNEYLHCRFGYFIPDGDGGVGAPLVGHYSIVYADNPAYFDARDGQVYAAQGVGGPVSVPLAPTVRHTYNYGWGIPSSRLTPVSNFPYAY